MLEIELGSGEYFNPRTKEFYRVERKQTLHFEHSLVSISKWEQKYLKPFLAEGKKSTDETLYYIKCMSLDKNISEEVFQAVLLDRNSLVKITEYIDSPATATTFYNAKKDGGARGKQKIFTSEYIYYIMVRYGIPFECQKWHLKRLITLIKIFEIEMSRGSKKSKMGRNETVQMYKSLNEQRKAASGTKG